MPKQCMVLNCGIGYGDTSLHRFPNPKKDFERFQKWISLSGNLHLLEKDVMQIYSSNSICRRHFVEADFVQRNLSKSAIPKLHLPDAIDIPAQWKSAQQRKCASRSVATVESPTKGYIWESKHFSSPIRVGISPRKSRYGSSPKEIAHQEVQRSLFTESAPSGSGKPTAAEEELRKVPEFESVPLPVPTLHPSVLHRQSAKVPTVRKLTRKHLEELKLRQQVASLKRKLRYNERKKLSLRKLLSNAKKEAVKLNKLSPTVLEFIHCQIENASRKGRGKRFSMNDKVLALALYKRSPKCYKILSKVFALPGPHTLRNLLNRIPISPGICDPLLRNLKLQVEKMSGKDRFCILMFDEMSLSAHLDYMQHQDLVVGLEDDGYHRTLEIADHVQVYMLRGIFKKWKQVVAYTFCKSTTSAPNIVSFYKSIVKAAHLIGLNVIASVCDQGATNTKALKMLREESRANALRKGELVKEGIITIDENDVIPLFDPPHLLKSICNNLLTKDLQFIENGTCKVAKWSHIEDAYYIDASAGKLRVMRKLTDFHVVPSKIRKMKVSACSQVFSTSGAAAISLMSRSKSESVDKTRQMVAEAQDTADLCYFLDVLFDSVNGGFSSLQAGKQLRMAVTERSRHKVVWNNSIEVIKSMKFICRRPNDQARPAVLDNWISTLRGFKLIQETLCKLGYNFFSGRAFNQDSIENFFGQVRQHGERNVNPTCLAFGSCFKALLVNNFVTVYSPVANCEADGCESFLLTIREFLTQGIAEPAEPEPWTPPALPMAFEPLRPLELAAVGYISGWVAKNIFPVFKDCPTCLRNVLHSGESVSELHGLISEREYDDIRRLKYCNEHFINCLTHIHNIFYFVFPISLNKKQIFKKIQSYLSDNITFSFFPCPHTSDLETVMLDSFLRLLIFYYIKRINNLTAGKETNISSPDNIQKKALAHWQSKMKRKK